MISRDVLERYGMPLTSLLLAILLWFYVVSQKEMEWPFSIPVSVVVSSTELDGWAEPAHVSVVVKGPRRVLERIPDQEMEIRLVVIEKKPGESTRGLLPSMVTGLPSGVQIMRMEPAEVRVAIRPLVEESFKVTPQFSSGSDPSFVVSDVKVEPRSIKLRSRAERLREVDDIMTELIPMPSSAGEQSVMAAVAVPEGTKAFPQAVRVTFSVTKSDSPAR